MAHMVLHLLTMLLDGRKANPGLDRSMRYALHEGRWRGRDLNRLFGIRGQVWTGKNIMHGLIEDNGDILILNTHSRCPLSCKSSAPSAALLSMKQLVTARRFGSRCTECRIQPLPKIPSVSSS